MTDTTSPVTISFVVPCFNSAGYMDRCIGSLLGADDVEIIIVDDGSTLDDTAAKADRWQADHPDIVKVIHQTNKGHGGAVMAGVQAAQGVWLAVVDSDDRLDPDGLTALLARLRQLLRDGQQVDLVVANCVFEHAPTGTSKTMRFHGALPANRVIRWDETGTFGNWQHITMHSAIFRTQVLRDSGMELPENLYYVDNIYVYAPLPYVKTLYYLPVDLYRYFIGRDDQSVNEAVLLRQLDQHILVARIMMDTVELPTAPEDRKLAAYMAGFLGKVITASAALATVDGSPQALASRYAIWRHIDTLDKAFRTKLKRQVLVVGSNLPGAAGRAIARTGYHVARRIYRFM